MVVVPPENVCMQALRGGAPISDGVNMVLRVKIGLSGVCGHTWQATGNFRWLGLQTSTTMHGLASEQATLRTTVYVSLCFENPAAVRVVPKRFAP